MYHFKTLTCHHCNSVLLNLPSAEIEKLNGMTYQCECCGHQNILADSKFHSVANGAPTMNVVNIESLTICS